MALPQLLLRGVVAGQGTGVHQVLRDGAHGGGHDGGSALPAPPARVRREPIHHTARTHSWPAVQRVRLRVKATAKVERKGESEGEGGL